MAGWDIILVIYKKGHRKQYFKACRLFLVADNLKLLFEDEICCKTRRELDNNESWLF